MASYRIASQRMLVPSKNLYGPQNNYFVRLPISTVNKYIGLKYNVHIVGSRGCQLLHKVQRICQLFNVSLPGKLPVKRFSVGVGFGGKPRFRFHFQKCNSLTTCTPQRDC